MAARSHKYVCYEAALQPRPGDDVSFYLHQYRRRQEYVQIAAETEGEPLLLREDFSGTGMVSIEWLKTDPRRKSWAVDTDPEVFDWCGAVHIPKLSEDAKERLTLEQRNVLEVAEAHIPAVDVVCANNFSWQCFKDESTLMRYFQGAFDGLGEGGIFVLDIFGGRDTEHESHELISSHEIQLSDGQPGEFSYVYEQIKVDQESKLMDIGVSFDFSDGSSLQHAFSYQWRVWSYRQVQALLQRAGFRSVQLFRDYSDDDGKYRHGDAAMSLQEWEALVQEDKYQSAYVVSFK